MLNNKPYISFPDYGSNVSISSTLNQGGTLNSVEDEIILTDASNFPTMGKISINSETIFYNGKNNNTLTGCSRGKNSTTATSHSNGSVVNLLPRQSQASRTLSSDLYQTGWYNDRAQSQRALRVGFTNMMMPGTIRFNTDSNIFQGFNGSEWVTFNGEKGEQGIPGTDTSEALDFQNLGTSTSGEIYSQKVDNVVQFRTLKAGTFELNAKTTAQSTFTISKSTNYLTLYPAPRPYIWDFTSGNDLDSLKSTNSDSKFNAMGTVMKFNVKSGNTVSKGTCVRLTLSTNSTSYIDSETYLVIEPYTYNSLIQETREGSAILGIALETKSGGQPCEVCVQGITSVIIGEGGGAGGQTSTIINGPSAYGFVGFDGKVYNEAISSGISVNTPVAGFWLERGGFNLGDPVLFYVQGTFAFT